MTTRAPFRDALSVSGDLARGLLAAGVPLTLLLDLMEPAGPDSAAIMAAEAVPATGPALARPRLPF